MAAESSSTPVAESAPPKEAKPRGWGRIIAAAVFLCLLGGMFFWFGSRSPLEEARKAAAAGQVQPAKDAYERHLIKHPDDWKVVVEYGTFLKQHDAASALKLLTQVPKESAEFVPAARQIAHIAVVGKRDVLAETALKALYESNPSDHDVVLTLAQIYHRQAKDRDALPLAVKAAELKPDQIEDHLFLAQIYFAVGRPSEMVEPLLKALKIDPNNREAHLNLAYSYRVNSQYDKARKEAQWSQQHDPTNVQVWRVLGEIELEDSNPKAALEYAKKGLEIDPNELECRVVEGRSLALLGKFQEAYDHMLPVYERLPREQRIVAVLAEATRALKMKDEAAKFQKLLGELGNENYRAEKKPEGK